MIEEIKTAVWYGLATGITVGALRWCWIFFYRRVLSLFGERLILE